MSRCFLTCRVISSINWVSLQLFYASLARPTYQVYHLRVRSLLVIPEARLKEYQKPSEPFCHRRASLAASLFDFRCIPKQLAAALPSWSEKTLGHDGSSFANEELEPETLSGIFTLGETLCVSQRLQLQMENRYFFMITPRQWSAQSLS